MSCAAAEWLKPAANTRPKPRTTADTIARTSVFARTATSALVIILSPNPSHPTGIGFTSQGRSPGSRVVALSLPSRFPSGVKGALTAYSRGGGCGLRSPVWIYRYHIPGYPLTRFANACGAPCLSVVALRGATVKSENRLIIGWFRHFDTFRGLAAALSEAMVPESQKLVTKSGQLK